MSNAEELETPDIFGEIISNIGKKVSLYDNILEEIVNENQNQQISLQIPQKIKEKLKDNLMKTENNTYLLHSEVDEIRQWVEYIQNDNILLDLISENSEAPKEDVSIVFKTTSDNLLYLSRDIHKKIYEIITRQETPESVRLDSRVVAMREEYSNRKRTDKKLTKQLKEATNLFDMTKDRHKMLSDEIMKFDNQMIKLKDKKSYDQIEKAKKDRILKEQWRKNKHSLNSKIHAIDVEIASMKNCEKCHKDLTKVIAANENECNKKRKDYDEIINSINQEMMVCHYSQLNNFQMLEKEMKSSQNTHKNNEIKTLQMEKKKMINSFTHIMSKYSKDKQTNRSKLEKELRKNNITFENAAIAFDAFKNAERINTNNVMGEMINELTKVKNDYEEIFISANRKEDKRRVMKNEQDKEILISKKQRILSQITDRDIETAMNLDSAVTLEGIIVDICESFNVLKESNSDMKGKINEKANEKDCLKKQIFETDNFILKGTKIIGEFNKLLIQKMNKQNDLITQIPKRPNSMIYSSNFLKNIDIIKNQHESQNNECIGDDIDKKKSMNYKKDKINQLPGGKIESLLNDTNKEAEKDVYFQMENKPDFDILADKRKNDLIEKEALKIEKRYEVGNGDLKKAELGNQEMRNEKTENKEIRKEEVINSEIKKEDSCNGEINSEEIRIEGVKNDEMKNDEIRIEDISKEEISEEELEENEVYKKRDVLGYEEENLNDNEQKEDIIEGKYFYKAEKVIEESNDEEKEEEQNKLTANKNIRNHHFLSLNSTEFNSSPNISPSSPQIEEEEHLDQYSGNQNISSQNVINNQKENKMTAKEMNIGITSSIKYDVVPPPPKSQDNHFIDHNNSHDNNNRIIDNSPRFSFRQKRVSKEEIEEYEENELTGHTKNETVKNAADEIGQDKKELLPFSRTTKEARNEAFCNNRTLKDAKPSFFMEKVNIMMKKDENKKKKNLIHDHSPHFSERKPRTINESSSVFNNSSETKKKKKKKSKHTIEDIPKIPFVKNDPTIARLYFSDLPPYDSKNTSLVFENKEALEAANKTASAKASIKRKVRVTRSLNSNNYNENIKKITNNRIDEAFNEISSQRKNDKWNSIVALIEKDDHSLSLGVKRAVPLGAEATKTSSKMMKARVNLRKRSKGGVFSIRSIEPKDENLIRHCYDAVSII